MLILFVQINLDEEKMIKQFRSSGKLSAILIGFRLKSNSELSYI